MCPRRLIPMQGQIRWDDSDADDPELEEPFETSYQRQNYIPQDANSFTFYSSESEYESDEAEESENEDDDEIEVSNENQYEAVQDDIEDDSVDADEDDENDDDLENDSDDDETGDDDQQEDKDDDEGDDDKDDDDDDDDDDNDEDEDDDETSDDDDDSDEHDDDDIEIDEDNASQVPPITRGLRESVRLVEDMDKMDWGRTQCSRLTHPELEPDYGYPDNADPDLRRQVLKVDSRYYRFSYERYIQSQRYRPLPKRRSNEPQPKEGRITFENERDLPKIPIKDLTMELLCVKNKYKYFKFTHGPLYQQGLRDFNSDSIGYSHDEKNSQSLADYTTVEAIMQRLEYLELSGEDASAELHLTGALIAMLKAARFPFSISDGYTRLEYEHVENRPFHMALLRYIQVLSKKGSHRSALEVAKLMINLDPKDPLGVFFAIDTLADKAGQDEWLLKSYNLWYQSKDPTHHFHMRYSHALARFKLACRNEDIGQMIRANHLVKLAMMRHPMVALMIMRCRDSNNDLEINHCHFTAFLHNYSSSVEKQMYTYANYVWRRWEENHAIEWMVLNAQDMLVKYKTLPALQMKVAEVVRERELRMDPYPLQMMKEIHTATTYLENAERANQTSDFKDRYSYERDHNDHFRQGMSPVPDPRMSLATDEKYSYERDHNGYFHQGMRAESDPEMNLVANKKYYDSGYYGYIHPDLSPFADPEPEPDMHLTIEAGMNLATSPGMNSESESDVSSEIDFGMYSDETDTDTETGLDTDLEPDLEMEDDPDTDSEYDLGMNLENDPGIDLENIRGMSFVTDPYITSDLDFGMISDTDSDMSSGTESMIRVSDLGQTSESDPGLTSVINPELNPVTDSGKYVETDHSVSSKTGRGISCDTDQDKNSASNQKMSLKSDPGVSPVNESEKYLGTDPGISFVSDLRISLKKDPGTNSESEPSMRSVANLEIGSEADPGKSSEIDLKMSSDIDPGITLAINLAMRPNSDPRMNPITNPMLNSDTNPNIGSGTDPSSISEIDLKISFEADRAKGSKTDPRMCLDTESGLESSSGTTSDTIASLECEILRE